MPIRARRLRRVAPSGGKDIDTAQLNRTALCGQQAEDGLQRDGLPRAGPAQQGQCFARRNVEVEVFDDGLAAKGNAQILNAENGLVHHTIPNKRAVSRKFEARIAMALETTADVVARPTPCAPAEAVNPW